MKKKYSGIKSMETHEFTPFVKLVGFKWHGHYTKEKSHEVFKTDGGEAVHMVTPGRYAEYLKDEASFVKVYLEGIIDFDKLSAAALKVLMWVMKNVKMRDEEITIPPALLMQELGYKKHTQVYTGAFELCKFGILAKKVGVNSDYFINPNKLFNGHRDTLADKPFRQEWVKEVEKEGKRKQKTT